MLHNTLARFVILVAALAAVLGAVAFANTLFDGPVSECGEDAVVFAMNVDSENRSAFLDLPAGLYKTRLIARGTVNLGEVGTGRRTNPRRPYVSVMSWRSREVGSLAHGEWTMWEAPVVADGATAFSSLVGTPGGIARFDLGIHFGGPDDWLKSSAWRWEIIAPGVCSPPAAN